MPQEYNRSDREPIQAGRMKTRIAVYDPARGVDSAGAILREPGAAGGGPQTDPIAGTRLWVEYAETYHYGKQSRTIAGQETGETWKTIEVYYGAKKPWKSGLLIQNLNNGEWFEMMESCNVGDDNRKVQLTCRQVKG